VIVWLHQEERTARCGDKETRRQGDKETRRQGDKETRRQGDKERFTRSPWKRANSKDRIDFGDATRINKLDIRTLKGSLVFPGSQGTLNVAPGSCGRLEPRSPEVLRSRHEGLEWWHGKGSGLFDGVPPLGGSFAKRIPAKAGTPTKRGIARGVASHVFENGSRSKITRGADATPRSERFD